MSRLHTLWLLLATSITLAEAAPPEQAELTLPEAAARVLERNPQLRAADYARGIAAADKAEASFKPQWSVSLELEDLLGTGAMSGFDSSQSTLRLSRIFQPADIRATRMDAASAFGDRTNNEIDGERLDLMTQVAMRFLEVVYRQELLRLAELSVDLWQDARDLAMDRERAGAAPAADRLRTEIRVAQAELDLASARGNLEAARMSLSGSWGGAQPDFARAGGALCSLSALPAFDDAVTRIDRNPDLLRFASEQRLWEAEARLAVAQQRPSWTLSAGVRHLATSGDQAFVVGFSVPLGQKARSAPSQQRATARGQQATLQAEAFRLEARATLFDVFQQAAHATREVQLFDDTILPKARAIRNEIEAGYGVGRFSHTALVNAQTELLVAAKARIDSCADHHRLLIDIERLTGGDSLWLTTEDEVSP